MNPYIYYKDDEHTRLLYYFVLWVLGQLHPVTDASFMEQRPRWKEEVCFTEGIYLSPKKWRARVMRYQKLQETHYLMLNEIAKACNLFS